MFLALAVVILQNNACKHSGWNLSMLPVQRWLHGKLVV